MTSIYELKMGAEKLEALKFLLSQIKDLEAAVKSIDVNELREFRYLAEKMQGLSDDVEKSKELIDKAKNNLAPIVTEVESAGKNAKDEINLKTEAFSALLTRKTEEFEQVKTSFERKYEELATLKSQMETIVATVTSPIDDSERSESKTYSSKKIEDTFAKKGESASSGVDEAKVNELIDAKAANLANKDELADKLSTTIYEEDKKTLATKLDVTNAVSNKIDTTTLNSAIGGLATALENKISTLAATAVTQTVLNKYTKAQNISGNTIDFMQGVNFTGSVSGQITAGAREAGQSGLVYINGNGVSGFSSDFVILNPSEATYGQGYVFFSYFVRPTDSKVLISFIKAA